MLGLLDCEVNETSGVAVLRPSGPLEHRFDTCSGDHPVNRVLCLTLTVDPQQIHPALRIGYIGRNQMKFLWINLQWIAKWFHVARQHFCRGCGKKIANGRLNCASCAVEGATVRLAGAAKLGRAAAQSPQARAKHVASRKRHAQACSAWDESTQPDWLTSEVFSQQIQPLLAKTPTTAIRSRIGVSRRYAGRIRERYRPHPRHWLMPSAQVSFSDMIFASPV